MTAREELKDREFGRWKVLGPGVEPGKWHCLCDPQLGGCGTERDVAGSNLRAKGSRSCGCLTEEARTAYNAAKAVFAPGDVVERLTVLGRVKGGWRCRCVCGTELTTPRLSRRPNSGAKSCGCLQRQRASEGARKKSFVRPGYVAGRLTVLRRDPLGSALWECACACAQGKTVLRSTNYFRQAVSKLDKERQRRQQPWTPSCGCLRDERLVELFGVRVSVMAIARMTKATYYTVVRKLDNGLTPEEALRPSNNARLARLVLAGVPYRTAWERCLLAGRPEITRAAPSRSGSGP